MEFMKLVVNLYEDDEEKKQTPKTDDKKAPKTDDKDKDKQVDSDENWEPEQEDKDEESDMTMNVKFEELSKSTIKGFEQFVATAPDTVMDNVRNIGIKGTIKNYLENYFIKNLDKQEDKLFLTINIDEYIDFITIAIKDLYTDKAKQGK